MKSFNPVLCRLIVLSLFSPERALADWASNQRYAAIAELRIENGQIGVDLRANESAANKLALGTTDFAQAAPALLAVYDARQQPMATQIRRDAEPLPATASTEGQLKAQWTLPLPNGTTSLTLTPRAGLAADSLGLIVLHRGVPVSDLIGLDKPQTLTLDPTDPWLSHFDDTSLMRRHAEPKSFVYVEPYEVRHEVLIRLKDLLGFVDPEMAARNKIGPTEVPALKQKLGQFLLMKNPLVIDGQTAHPLLDRVEFVAFSRSGMTPLAEGQDIETQAALVGVVIVYLTDQPAQDLRLQWELFGASASRTVSVLLGKESFDGDMTPQSPGFDWSRSEALEPSAQAAPEEAEPQDIQSFTDKNLPTLLQSLLHNAYRAFQLRDEEAAYDRMARSLDYPLLEDIYLQQRSSQIRQTKGLGGEGRVEKIEVLSAQRLSAEPQEPSATGDVHVAASWKAQGEVSHWGHSHKRDNLYAATLTLRQSESGPWKIVAMNFRDGQRLDGAPHR